MLGSCETRRMLRRIEADACLPAEAENILFEAITLHVSNSPLSSGLAFRARAIWAKTHLLAALADIRDSVCVRGPQIAANRFTTVVRIRPARDYRWCLPTLDRQRFFDDFGIEGDEWSAADDHQLREWIEAHYGDYTGAIEVSGRSGPAFVTDNATIPAPMPSFQEFQRLLGLLFSDGNRTLGLLWRYSRAALQATGNVLCVPRSVDGLDYQPFEMERNCGAPHGNAKQPDGTIGLPEAVHRGCQIPQAYITLEFLN